MQNYYQKPIQRVSNELRDRFDEFFLYNAKKTTSNQKNITMPEFQIKLFIDQAIENKRQVVITAKSSTSSSEFYQAHGQITKLKNDRYLIKSSNSLTSILTPDQITFIALD